MNGEDHKGHRERLRRRFLDSGTGGMHDYEVVELLLTYVIPRRDVKPIAKELISMFGSLAGVLDASIEALSSVHGVSVHSAALVKLVKEIGTDYLEEKMGEQDVITSPEAVQSFARMKLASASDETCMAVFVNTKNHVIDHEILNRGTVNQTAVYPRSIVRKALEVNATGVILVHNHPSGVCDPSPEDMRLTAAVKAAAETMGIRLLDHLIVGKGGYLSFVETGLL